MFLQGSSANTNRLNVIIKKAIIAGVSRTVLRSMLGRYLSFVDRRRDIVIIITVKTFDTSSAIFHV